MRSSRLSYIALAAAALWLCATPARADWKKDYDLGLKAIESGQWAEAERAFAAALADDGIPSARKRFQGTVFKVYVPHYYAGLAAYRQGDCRRAVEFWNHGPTGSVLAGQSDLVAQRSQGMSDCNRRLAAATRPDASSPTTPTRPATSGATSSAPARPVANVPAAKPPAASTPPPARPPAATVAAIPAPEGLRAAVENYLAGRYAAVMQVEPTTFTDGRARAQVHVLRAASRYTLAQLDQGDPAQLEQARREVRAARAANAVLSPDETIFSPRFRTFWRETR